MENASNISYQLSSDTMNCKSLTISCPHCDQHYSEESIKIATFLYGAFFLADKETAYVGITCPSCLKTIYKKDSVQKINVTLNNLSSFIDLGNSQLDPNLRYFSSTRTSHEKIPEIEMFDIPQYEILTGPDFYDNELEAFLEFQIDNPKFEEEYLCSFISSGPRCMGYHCLVLWFKPDEIDRLVKIENEDSIKIFPRYYYKSSLIEEVNFLCWENYLYERDLIDAMRDYEERKEKLKKKLKFAGIDSNKIEELCISNLGITPAGLNNMLGQFREQKAKNFSFSSKFFEILASDSNPWEKPLSTHAEHKGLWKTKFPFQRKKVPESFSSFDSSDYEKKPEKNTHQKMVDEIEPNFSKSYVQIFLSENQINFIKEYVDLTETPFFSYADLWELKEKYLKLLYNHIKKEALHESQYVFCKEGGSWRVIYNGKNTGGYNGTGFKYLQFLVSNKFKGFSFYMLDDLDGIVIRDDDTSSSSMFEEEAETLLLVAAGSGSSNKGNEEARRRKLRRGRLDHRSMISPEQKETLENYRNDLIEEIEELKKTGNAQSLNYAENLEKQLKQIDKYLKDTVTKGGAIKRFRSDSEYKKVKDKINIAIKRALENIKEHDEDAWQHFDNYLYSQHGEKCYRPDPDINWITG
jgi:hypothetical protein